MTKTLFGSLQRDGRIDEDGVIAAEGSESAIKAVQIFAKNPDVDIGSEDLIDAGGDYSFPTIAQVMDVVSTSANDDGVAVNATEIVTVEDPTLLLAQAAFGSIEVVDWEEAQGRFAIGNVTIVDWTKCAELQATGAITYNTPVATDTVVVSGNTFTCVASSPSVGEFSSISELTALIDAISGLSATDNGTTITILADAGDAGNSVTLAIGSNIGSLAISGATLTGGRDALTVTINETDYIANIDFIAETSHNQTAANLAAAIDDADIDAGAAGNVVNITATAEDETGNSIVLATSNSQAATVSDDTLLGGNTPLTITIGSTDLVEGVDFDAVTSEAVTASNLAAAITNSEEGVTAVNDGSTVNITASATDTSGNSIALVTDNTDAATISDDTLTGGVDLDVLTIGGYGEYEEVTFTPGVDYDVDPDSAENTASNLTDAINESDLVGVTAVLDGADVDLTAKTAGVIANTTPVSNPGEGLALDNGDLEGGVDVDGTGARTVLIKGLDVDYTEISEVIALNGTSAVTTVNEYLRINSFEVVTAGSGGTNAGAISITGTEEMLIAAQILTGNGKAYTGVYTVPADFTAFIKGRSAALLATITAVTTVQVLKRSPDVDAAWVAVDAFPGQSEPVGEMEPPVAIEQKSDIRLRGTSASNNVVMTAQLNLIVVANDPD